MSSERQSSSSSSSSRVRDYNNSSNEPTYSWRDGYKARVMKKNDTSYTAPEFATAPKQRMSEAYFEVYREEAQILKTIHLYARLNEGLMIVFGRDPSAPGCNTEVIDNASISRNHAALVCTKEGLMIIDLYSRSGTYINDHKLTPGVGEPIFETDVLRFGACSRVLRLKNTGYRRKEAEEHFLKVAREKFESGKLDRTVSGGVDRAPAPEPSVKCSHILLKHTGSRTPSTDKGPVTRTLEQAREELAVILDQVVADPSLFAGLAEKHSECSSFKRGGDLGFFVHKRMQPSFADAAFALNVGQISGLVESPSGVHIILRTA